MFEEHIDCISPIERMHQTIMTANKLSRLCRAICDEKVPLLTKKCIVWSTISSLMRSDVLINVKTTYPNLLTLKQRLHMPIWSELCIWEKLCYYNTNFSFVWKRERRINVKKINKFANAIRKQALHICLDKNHTQNRV